MDPILSTSTSDVGFSFERSRGLVWVCDVAQSTRVLNDDESVDALEEFLPRLYWGALQAVDSAGATFVKWTGDGFLAWLETPLERGLGKHAASLFEAAWHLAMLVNVTGLGVKSSHKLRLRHAVAYEPDALLMRILSQNGHTTHDLLGRSITAAFRMSTIACSFPGIVSESRVVRAYAQTGRSLTSFVRRRLTADERLRVFHGERFGTGSLYVTAVRKRPKSTLLGVVKQSKRALAALDVPAPDSSIATKFLSRMMRGPQWARDAMREQNRFIKDELAGSLKRAIPVLERQLGSETEA